MLGSRGGMSVVMGDSILIRVLVTISFFLHACI